MTFPLRRHTRALCPFLLMISALVLSPGMLLGQTTSTQEKAWPDPQRFEKAISEFEAQDRVTSPPAGAIVCVGSSSMRGWHKSIEKDLAPLTVIARGFGGSTMNDALYYAERVVIAYRPRAVVVYEGDNDISMGISPERFRDKSAEFAGKLREALPQVRIYFLSIKPSPSRWAKWPQMKAANELLRQFCEQSDGMTYIDVATPMLDSTTGKPKEEIFLKDMLHMNAKGYELWTAVVKPVLMEKEGRYEEARRAEAGEWKPLFDGKTLEGWVKRGGEANYRVENGVIVGSTVPKTPNTFLCTEKDYADFILEVETKVDPQLNSGIQIRSQSLPEYKNGRVHGYQVEIDPSERAYSGGIYDEGRRGWLKDLKDNEAGRKAFRQNEWNSYRIEAVGDSFRTWVNGVPTAELRDSMTTSGFIALQVHAHKSTTPLEVRWRNIRLQELSEK